MDWAVFWLAVGSMCYWLARIRMSRRKPLARAPDEPSGSRWLIVGLDRRYYYCLFCQEVHDQRDDVYGEHLVFHCSHGVDVATQIRVFRIVRLAGGDGWIEADPAEVLDADGSLVEAVVEPGGTT